MSKSKKKFKFAVEVFPNRYGKQIVYVLARHAKGAVAIAKEYGFEATQDLMGKPLVKQTTSEQLPINLQPVEDAA